jgi:acetyl-CoA C-acetyltransferase
VNKEREVVVLSGVRTAIGRYGGSLKDHPPTVLAAAVVREAVQRAGIEPGQVGHVVFGNVIHTDPHDHYMARWAAIKGGLPVEVPAFTLNRLCGSGMQAIVSAAQIIKLGEAEAAVAGGAESMSRGQYWLPGMRWGQRMNDAKVIDAVVGALNDPFDDCHMGITAENVAKKWGISREAQDELAVESHRRAAQAIKEGRFKEQILPIEIKAKGGTALYDTDEHVRYDATLESLAKLKPVFDPNGTVTAGNASGMNDAAAAVVLMERSAAERQGLKPRARLVAYGYSGVDPKYMGIGPVPAVRNALERAGLQLSEMDVIELNEAFAAQALAVIRLAGLDIERVNIDGGAIALGHPLGATGAKLTATLMRQLERRRARYGMVTMCVGGGQGAAGIFERLTT